MGIFFLLLKSDRNCYNLEYSSIIRIINQLISISLIKNCTFLTWQQSQDFFQGLQSFQIIFIDNSVIKKCSNNLTSNANCFNQQQQKNCQPDQGEILVINSLIIYILNTC